MPDKWAQYAEKADSGGDKWAKYAADAPDTRGLDKLPGGVAPGVEKPSALPDGSVASEDRQSKPFNLEKSINEGAFPGPGMVSNGIRDLFTRALPAAANGNGIRAAHETISGIGRAALPLAAPALIQAPIATAIGMGGSYLGSQVGRQGAKALGLNPDQSNLMEDVGGIAGGGIASPKVRAFAGGAAKAAPEAIKSAALPELASLALHGTPRKIAAGLAVAQAAPGIIRGGVKAAASEPWLPRGLFSKEPIAVPQRKLLNSGPIIGDPPPDASFVRGASAMAHPPNPARALPAAPRVLATEPPPDASFVRGVPAELPRREPVSQVRGLLGAGSEKAPLITPQPADTSFVRGVPAEYPVKELGFEPIRGAQVTPVQADPALLDGIARGQSGRKFTALSPEEQTTVRRIAGAVVSPAERPQPISRPAVTASAPEPPGDMIGAPDLSDVLQQSIDRVRASGSGNTPISVPPSGMPLRVRRR